MRNLKKKVGVAGLQPPLFAPLINLLKQTIDFHQTKNLYFLYLYEN